jgi:hypothetical protein
VYECGKTTDVACLEFGLQVSYTPSMVRRGYRIYHPDNPFSLKVKKKEKKKTLQDPNENMRKKKKREQYASNLLSKERVTSLNGRSPLKILKIVTSLCSPAKQKQSPIVSDLQKPTNKKR